MISRRELLRGGVSTAAAAAIAVSAEPSRRGSLLTIKGKKLGTMAASGGLVLLLLSMAAAQSLAPAPNAQVRNLTPEPGYFNEPSVAINPRDPQQLVAAYQVNAGVAYSEDGGRNWKLVSGVAPKNYKKSGDVSVTYDAHGHAILCYIAFDKLGTQNYWAHNATRNGIFVKRSLDGGRTWEAESVPVIEHATNPGIPFEDKPYIVADNTNGPYSGNIYVGWTQFTLSKSMILSSRSTDGGKSWSEPIKISTHEGLPRDDNGAVEGFTGAVAPDGTLYVVWADGNSIVLAESRDGGRSFGRSRKILDTAPSYFDVADVYRSNGFPEIGLDPRGDSRGSVLYVTWSDYRNGDVDVFCSSSRTHGRSWGPVVRVNSDPVHNGSDQFFQWLAVDAETGDAYVIFYDRRSDPENRKTTVALARSTDGGKSFTNHSWTERPFEANDDFLGDYTGIAALGGRVYGVWTEEQTATASSRAGRNAVSAAPDTKKRHTVIKTGMADFSHANGPK